jgi:hypothetical protein
MVDSIGDRAFNSKFLVTINITVLNTILLISIGSFRLLEEANMIE